MRFAIKHAHSSGERIGNLTEFVRHSAAIIETPTSALLTQGGSVVHLTSEVLEKVFSKPQLLWVALSNSIQLETGVKLQGEGVGKFAGLPEHIICTTLHNISENVPPGHFELNKVPLWTKNGKKMINADRYIESMETFKPDIIFAVSDNRTSLHESFKRISKSVDRTCSMLDICVERCKSSKQLANTSLLGVIVGGAVPKKYQDCIKHILKHKEYIDGVVLSGITDGTEESYKISTDKLAEIFKTVAEALPQEWVRVVEGCWNPAVVVAAIEYGWDIFDGSYPLKLTNAGQALSLNFDSNRSAEEMCIMDLSDVKYKEDFRPIKEGCECLACKKHTRAYIRHLLNAREMLSSVLLSIHNLHHFDEMFLRARHHIAANTFQEYKQLITEQYELYRATNPITEPATSVENGTSSITNDVTTKTKQNKKKRVSRETSNNVDS